MAASDTPRIHFDSLWDKVQLGQAMSEWGRNPKGIPPFVPVLIDRHDVRDEVELYFQNNPDALARRHHALVDAEALRHAFVVVGRRSGAVRQIIGALKVIYPYLAHAPSPQCTLIPGTDEARARSGRIR